MRPSHLVTLGAITLIAGCHSAVIDASLTNATAQPAQLLEVDYPSASFGTQTLAPGQTFHYRFKVLGNGPLKLTWTDTARHDHAATGPALTEGTEGTLAITLSPDGSVSWRPVFKPAP